MKAPRHRLYSELQLLLMLTTPWKNILIDMIVGLPLSTDSNWDIYNVILIVMDHFTKMVRYFPVQKMMAAPQLADLFCKEIVKHYGTLRSIVADRAGLFMEGYWSTLCYYMKAKHRLSTAFHSQTDGQIEQQNQVLEHYL